MTKFRERAAEVKAAGEQARGDYTPHGKPAKNYAYWLENSKSVTAWEIRDGDRRENFCHYWRVAVLWGPLLKFRTKHAAGLRAVGAPFRGLGQLPFEKIMLGFIGLLLLSALGVLAYLLVTSIAEVGILHVLMWAGILLVLAVGLVAIILLFALGLSKLGNLLAIRRRLRYNRLREAENNYYEEHGEFPAVAQEPGAVTKFFMAVGDFLVLLGQVVRVNKWKICPFVNIEVK